MELHGTKHKSAINTCLETDGGCEDHLGTCLNTNETLTDDLLIPESLGMFDVNTSQHIHEPHQNKIVLYTIILTAGVLNLYAVLEDTGMFIFSLVMIIFSVFCIIASVLLLIGLCVDSRKLLIPWLVLVLVTTFVDLLISLYLLIEALFDPFLAILFAVDFLILSLNTYSLICVYSQYQEYCAGRGNPQVRGNRALPEVEFDGNRAGASTTARFTNDSAGTHSCTISVGTSSVPAVHSDINSTEESSAQYRTAEEGNLREIKEDRLSDTDTCNAQKNPENSITFIIELDDCKGRNDKI